MLQLRNEAQAEDVVQDTLIAILEKPERFAGQSSLRTYVTAIMKHKIIDVLRAAKRTRQIETYDDQTEALSERVRESPLVAVLVAAGVGYLLGRIAR